MQSTLDIKLSNARFKDQTAKQTKTQKTLNKQHEFAQLKTQNQLKPKQDSIRFKFVISQNQSSSIQKIEIFISKQFVLRQYLPQYIVDKKFVKNSILYIDFDTQKLFNSALRFIYNISMFNNTSVFYQYLYTTY